jgi:hypothetical protein
VQSKIAALCSDCQIGYHSPFDRFEQVATIPDGPTLLQRCSSCGALWQESLHDVKRVTNSEAASLFPDFVVKDPGRGV